MLKQVMLTVLQQSFTGSMVIVGLLLIRGLLFPAKKVWFYPFWAIPAVRMLIPFSFVAGFSLLPVHPETFRRGLQHPESPILQTGIPMLDEMVNPLLPVVRTSPLIPTDPTKPYWSFLAVVWMIGVAFLLVRELTAAYHLYKTIRVYPRTKQGNVYEVQGLESSFVSGVFFPKIYLPAGLKQQEKEFILLHEQVHIYRRDSLWKQVAFLLLCFHWFNPLVWIAFRLFCRDMEISCDELATRKLEESQKKAYAQLLLDHSLGKRWPARQIPFSAAETKVRIRRLMTHKKPPIVATLGLLLAAVFLGAGLLCSPSIEKNALDEIDVRGTGKAYQEGSKATLEITLENEDPFFITMELPEGVFVSSRGGHYNIANERRTIAVLQFGKGISADGIFRVKEKQVIHQPNPDWEIISARGYHRDARGSIGLQEYVRLVYGVNSSKEYVFWLYIHNANTDWAQELHTTIADSISVK